MSDLAEQNPDQRRRESLSRLAEGVLDVLVLGGGLSAPGWPGMPRCAAFASAWSNSPTSPRARAAGRVIFFMVGCVTSLRVSPVGPRGEHGETGDPPHRPPSAEPLAFVFPTRPGWTWAKWKLSVGVKLYDLLCGRRNLGKSTTLGRRRVYDLLPGLTKYDITGAVRYYDGLTNDARLVIDTLRSAANHGAIVANYCGFSTPSFGTNFGGAVCGTTCRQRDRGPRPAGCQRHRPLVGPNPHSHTRLRLTKGVHLVIDRRRLPVPDAVVLTEGSRILFAILGANG